jgi:hypothetical protein
MSRTRYAVLFCVFVTGTAFARDLSWYRDPGTPATFNASGFVFKIQLPRGWSAIDDGIVPPTAFAAACTVRYHIYTERKWDDVLAAGLDPQDFARAAREARELFKISGHPAVSSRATRDDHLLTHVYIDLSALVMDSAIVWAFEGDPSIDGATCEAQFLAVVRSSIITVDKAAQ